MAHGTHEPENPGTCPPPGGGQSESICGGLPLTLPAAPELPPPDKQRRPAFAVEVEELSQGEALAMLRRLNADTPVITINAAELLAKDMVHLGHDAGVIEAADFVEAYASKLDREAAGLTRDVLFALAAQLRASVGAKGVVRP